MQLQNFIRELERQYPVKLVADEAIRTIQLDLIFVYEEYRCRGNGTEVMERLIAYSDLHNKPIQLTPSNKFGGNKRRLKKFYRQFGFIKNKSKYYSMIRPVN